MADNSSNNSSGPRNWRDRVGVKGGMPKLADEFKKESKADTKPALEKPGQPAAQARQDGQKRPAPKPVSQPAPMAPRRPVPVAKQDSPAPAPEKQQGSIPSSKRSDAFAERLRSQREAAETLAKKRAEETRNRLAGATPDGSGPKFSFADEEIKAATHEERPQPPARPGQRPPVRQQTRSPGRSQARSEAPNPAIPRRTPSVAPATPVRPGPAARQTSGTPPYQPSDAFRQTRGYREFDDRSAPPVTAAAHDRYADPSAADQNGYTPPVNGGYRAPQTRKPYYADDPADDLFDDGPQAARSAPRRAGASDYSAAYRDYDEAFEYEEEPRSRGGIWIFVVLMLIVVAAIAAGAYWFINYGTKIGTNAPAGGNVPTVTAPEQPVKVAPKPADTTSAPGAPVRRKKIYDRILGNQTLEPEKLVPSEETPQTPPPAVVPEPAPAGDAPLGVQPLPLPLPPPPTIPGVQGGIPEGVPGAVSAKSNRVASLTTNSVAPGAGKTGQTIIAPTAAPQQAPTESTIQSGGQQAPLALPQIPAPQQPAQAPVPVQTPAQKTATSEATPPALPAPTTTIPTAALPAPPLPRRKPAAVVASARQAAQQARLAALARTAAPTPVVPTAPHQPLTGAGPVQLTPGTTGSQNFNTQQPVHPAPVVPAPRQSNTNIASLPRATQPPAAPRQPAAGGSGYVLQMSSFRDRDAATAEYRRLISRHGSVLSGLSPEIREADLGASGKFYKLRLGAVASRGQAAQLCNALIAAGEKDCLVRNR